MCPTRQANRAAIIGRAQESEAAQRTKMEFIRHILSVFRRDANQAPGASASSNAHASPEIGARVHVPALMTAHGLGGELLLHADHVEIQHFGVLHMLFEFLTFHTPRVSTRIRLDEITALEIIRPVLLPDYFVVSYAGAPEEETGYLRRAFAANAMMMSYFDNRDFYALLARLTDTSWRAAGP